MLEGHGDPVRYPLSPNGRFSIRPRVLLADDHHVILGALETLLESEYEVVGKVGDGRELLKVAPELRPDVIVLDISMPRLNGMDAARQLLDSLPDVRLVFLTMHQEPARVAEALQAGALGYVLKASAVSELYEAVASALEGKIYVTPLVPRDKVDALLARPGREGGRLTPRQREVLQLLAEGLIMKQVARELGVTPRTVAFHKYRIMEEQGIDSNAGLVQLAIEEGLIDRTKSPPHE